MEKMLISGVASDKDIARISVIGIKNEPGKAFEIFSLMARERISVDIILQSIGRNNTKDISFTVHKADLKQAIAVLEANKERLKVDEIVFTDDVAKLSIVGAGMATNTGVASLMFEALFDAGININMISTSEIKISVLIDEKDVEAATIAVHDKFRIAHLSMKA